MTTRAREAIAAEFLRKALAIRAVAVPELDIMENPPPLRYRYFVAQSHTPCNRCVRFSTTVAVATHSLPSGRYSLLGPDLHRLDRTSFAWRTHSITSSAAACRLNGTVTPSVFAVLRLMTNSNLTGC